MAKNALSHMQLAQSANQSCLLATDKNDNEMTPGAVHRSPGIYLMAEVNPGKPQLKVYLMKAVQLVIASNEANYFQMRSVEVHSMSGRKKEGKTGRRRDTAK